MATEFNLPKRTARKILQRAGKDECVLCGWDKASCDVHHIIERKHGGSDELDNLIVVCPNCHRCIHQHGDEFATKEYLVEHSMLNMFPNWEEYYQGYTGITNPRGSKKPDCKHCGKEVPRHSYQYCDHECERADRRKFNWSKEALEELLVEFKGNKRAVGNHIGVADKTVAKYCQRYDLDFMEYRG